MNHFPFYIVDSFAEEVFSGNPAGVCLLNTDVSDAWMQSVAAEMRHSETAFVRPAGSKFSLRWFTPVAEVDLCGHATLAAAKIIYEMGLWERDLPILFTTRSGELKASLEGEEIALDFPAQLRKDAQVRDEWLQLFPDQSKIEGHYGADLLVRFPTLEAVRDYVPNFDAIAEIPVRGVIVTAPGDNGLDFVSRFFAPAFGVPEDPVTGSAHCALAPYWAAELGLTRMMLAAQLSPRGGRVGVYVESDRVLLYGSAQIVLRGYLV